MEATKKTAETAVGRRKKRKMYVFDYFNYVFMILFMFLTLYPLFYVLIGSFSEGLDFIRGGVYFLPRKWDLSNYMVVLTDPKIWTAFEVTIARTVVGTLTGLLFTAMVGYAMSRPNLKFRKTMYCLSIFTMFFSGGLVPFFLVIWAIGLYNTFWVYIIPAMYSVYNMIIIQNFFRSIPEELHEAAVVEGAGDFRIFATIYLSLSRPVLATVALWLAVGHWNDYYSTMVYTSSTNLQTLQYYMMRLISTANYSVSGVITPDMQERLTSETVTYAAIIVTVLPILIVYPFLQRYFESGIMIGSLKG